MQFYEKLDFLMNITKTTNSVLSLNIKLDPSYISRLRRGQRRALKDEVSLKVMAAYFARNCVADYQRKALADTMDVSRFLPNNNSKIAEMITQWLISEKKNDAKPVETFLSGLSNITEKQKILTMADLPDSADGFGFAKTDISIYYGVEGKRQAVVSFLSEVLAQDKPQSLLLFSDEATDWMTADREFAMIWASLMAKVLLKGNSIKIIHTISRDLDEMLNAIGQWMPLYMSGAIEPYFYPKKRDGIFKHTFFISPDISAVISSSVGSMINQAANLLIRNRDAIRAFEQEYYQYLNLCRPLMRIFTSKDNKAYFDTLLEFEKENKNSMIKTESLSLITMPESVICKILLRVGKTEKDLLKFLEKRKKSFENNIQTNSFTEIIHIFDAKKVVNAEVKIAYSVMLSGGIAYYAVEEYIQHLEHILYMLKEYRNFYVYLTEIESDNRYTVYAKEDFGVMVAKTSSPPVVLSINENNLTAAFWDFLMDMIEVKSYKNMKDMKEKEILKLTDYINLLKGYAEEKVPE